MKKTIEEIRKIDPNFTEEFLIELYKNRILPNFLEDINKKNGQPSGYELIESCSNVRSKDCFSVNLKLADLEGVSVGLSV